MGAVFEGSGFRVVVHGREPGNHVPHAHVINADGQVEVALGSARHPEYLLGAAGMKLSDVRRAVGLVTEHRDACWIEWRKFHGRRESLGSSA